MWCPERWIDMSCYPYSEGEGEREKKKKKNDSSTLFLSKKSCSIIVITVLSFTMFIKKEVLSFTKNCLHLIFYIVQSKLVWKVSS